MLRSRPCLWPSLAESSKDEERRQLASYSCDFSGCSYLTAYDAHPTTTCAADDINWRTASNIRTNICSPSLLRSPYQTPWCQTTDSRTDVQSSTAFLPRTSADCCSVDRICFTYGDDLIWRDPDEISKKFERDSGVALWGDPEIVNSRPVRNWLVGEGEDEDLETALASRPASPNDEGDSSFTVDHDRGDFARELPTVFPRLAAKKIVPTGWIELPSRDNSCSQRHDSAKVASCPSSGSANMFEFLGQHSDFFTQQDRLSPSAARFIGHLLALMPRLCAVEMDLKHIVNQVKNGIITEEQVARYMSQNEKVEYDRLVLGLAALRVEVASLLKRMQSSTRIADASNDRVALQDPPIYEFSFSL